MTTFTKFKCFVVKDDNIFFQEDITSEERILNVSFSARPSDARDSTTFFSSQYLQERVYLGRALLAKLTHIHVSIVMMHLNILIFKNKTELKRYD